MCGIAGLIGVFENPKKLVTEITDKLKHRGPDDGGYYFDEDEHVYLGHRRLSILDLSKAGHQPMEFMSNILVFNGEIYNHEELRKELSLKGYDFKSNTDTEVLLKGYDCWGFPELLDKILGMYAFAIYDKKNKKIYLARDRYGEKPLYYQTYDRKLIFCSEFNPIVCVTTNKIVNLNSVAEYFQFGYVPAPNTLVDNIFKLLPGHYVEFSCVDKRISEQIKYLKNKDDTKKLLSKNEKLTTIDKLLNHSVNLELKTDVSTGIFLSGGLDSSLIAYYAKKNSPLLIKSFGASFEDPSFNEGEYAEKVAKHLGIQHKNIHISNEEIVKVIEEDLTVIIDEPMSDMSLIPTYILCKNTVKDIKVVLGGDGADELFLGYPTHLANTIAYFYRYVPKFVTNFFLYMLYKLPASTSDFSLDFKLKKFLTSVYDSQLRRHINWQSHISIHQVKKIFPTINEFNWEKWEKNYTNKINNFDIDQYLANNILMKVDRASMINSLEVRSPYLFPLFFEFVYKIPIKDKYKIYITKSILKKLAIRFLPKEIVYRKKHGFGSPIGKLLKNELLEFSYKKIIKNITKLNIKLNEIELKNIFLLHKTGKADMKKEIWSLLILSLWLEKNL